VSTADDDPYAHVPDGRLKHMDLVQAVVARLGGNGFVVKGWAITVAGAFQGFGITRENGWLAVAGVVPTILFWFLDASFLRSERAFRMLFERVRIGDAEPFFMNATSPEYLETLGEGAQKALAWRRMILRLSLALFYAALIVSAIAIAVSIGIWTDGDQPVQSP